jgi:hypothetical protein
VALRLIEYHWQGDIARETFGVETVGHTGFTVGSEVALLAHPVYLKHGRQYHEDHRTDNHKEIEDGRL